MNAPRPGCPINLTLEALGDRWSLIVIRDLMFGNCRHLVVTFMAHDFGYVDLEQKTLQPIDNPFGAKVLRMSPA